MNIVKKMAIYNIVNERGIVAYQGTEEENPYLVEIRGTLSASNIIGTVDSGSYFKDGYDNEFIRIVAPSGSADFTSISSALNNIGNTIGIAIRPGNYYENPFIIPPNVRLFAPSKAAYVFANNSNQNFITMDNGSYINGLNIAGPGNAATIAVRGTNYVPIFVDHTTIDNSKIGIHVSGAGAVLSSDSLIISTCTTGVYVGSEATASFTSTDIVDSLVYGLQIKGFARTDSIRIFNFATVNTSSVGVFLDNGATYNFADLVFQNITTGIIGLRGYSRNIIGNSLQFINVPRPTLILSGSGYILVSNVVGDFSNTVFEQTQNIAITSFDTKPQEESFRAITDMSVGSFYKGNKLTTGEGGQSSVMLVFGSSSTGTWTDLTTTAINFSDAYFTFPGSSTNDSLYFALNISKSNGIGQHIYGFDVSLNSTASYESGSYIIWETWNGSTWTKVHSMATQLGDGYYDLNTGSFDRYTNQSIRLNQNVIAQSVSKSLDGITFSSSSQYWVRARITGALGAVPQIQYMKPYTNAASFGPDGFLTLHGAARANRTFPWSIFGTEKNFTATPTDQTLGMSDNISVGLVQNVLPDGSDRQIGFTNTMPLELDTSTQASMRFSFRPSATAAGNIIFKVRYSYSQDGDTLYDSLAAAPTTAVREATTIVTASGPFTAGSVRTMFASIFLEGFPTRQPGLGLSPVMWVTLERTGTDVADTYTGEVQLFDVSGRYTSWCLGGHAAFFT